MGDSQLNENTPVKLKILPRMFRITNEEVGEKKGERVGQLDVMLTAQQILEFECMYHFNITQDSDTPLTLFYQIPGEDKRELSLLSIRDERRTRDDVRQRPSYHCTCH